jgi:vanillate O-demethylase monooxygenase subunit
MKYVRNAWYVAGWAMDLEESTPLAVSILGEPLVLYRSGGVLAALEDRCVHRLAPLSLGRCEASNLRCMYHGLLFAPDGKVIEIPDRKLSLRKHASKAIR